MNPWRALTHRPLSWLIRWIYSDADVHQHMRCPEHPNPWHCQHGRHYKP